ncbi:hypothetical protein GCM10010218_32560 [Streptomyces mashuensis]|uniref:Methionyl/Leucyl tRNA synthetase domain-containing protein n=1 Tax=Streptomyces mashuensis TaxID=33904 RepID=A0A919B4V8_9ACTN|nr:class I tRNA ligase family protein [Streptomyces mashuensis]GHF48565.1 hypothetical protein GCM10010218_32560 [Streptomyces mashuensis]
MPDLLPTPHLPRPYLLVPPEPTPNGPLHLGHIAGPFLRLDVLARYLRLRGDRPVVMTGTDTYEPWVELKARTDGSTPAAVAGRYHAAIHADLAAMGIGTDAYLNPADEPWHTAFRAEIAACLRRLRERGALLTRTERIPYVPRTGRYLTGPMLLGRCPDCGAEAAGYGCEACGAQIAPEELAEPRPRFAEDAWEWRPIDTLYVRTAPLAWLEPEFDRLEVAPHHRETVRALLRRTGGTVRLSAPHVWGMPLPGREGAGGVPATLFSYTGGFMFARLLGELHGQRTAGAGAAAVNAFAPGSGVTTVTSLGCDNVISTLVCVNAVAPQHGDTRPYDRVLINEFASLCGEKFSTSRRHAIEVAALARVEGLPVDAVRYYLAKHNPEREPVSFEPKEFLSWLETHLAGTLETRVANAWERLPGPVRSGPGDGMLRDLRRHLDALDRALDGPRLHLAGAAAVLDAWIGAGPPDGGPDAPYWWLKGLALLGHPFMPGWCGALWNRLGAPGSPTLAAFPDRTAPVGDHRDHRRAFSAVPFATFASCLPAGLR